MSRPLTVTVGVLTAGRPDLLGPGLNSIARAKSNLLKPRRILVNNSTDQQVYAEIETLCGLSGVSPWFNTTPESLAGCWNRAAQWGETDVTVLLNDDVEVTDYWLDAVVGCLAANPEVGIVSLQQHRHAMSEGLHEPTYERRPYDVYTLGTGGYCFGFRTADWQAVDGFDEQFWRFYEDLDFGVKMTLRGRRNVDLVGPKVYHRIGATMAQRKGDTNAMDMRMSHAKFVRKWHEKLGLVVAKGEDGASDAPLQRITEVVLGRFPNDKPKFRWTQAVVEAMEATGQVFGLDESIKVPA